MIKKYLNIEKPVMNAIIAEFFLQLINASYLAILPLYMKSELFTDGEIGDSIKFRYLGVLLSALPVGLLIRKRKIKPFLVASTIFLPMLAMGILYTVGTHDIFLNHVFQILLCASFSLTQITNLPFILRNGSPENRTFSISLSYATWSVATIAGSLVIWVLNGLDPLLFSERNLLIGFTLAGCIGIYFSLRIRESAGPEPLAPRQTRSGETVQDWKIMLRALTPVLIIAVGAGFTIPFISLFFTQVHNLSTSDFGLINFIAAILVATASLMVPKIKEQFGYRLSVPLTQSLAIIALVAMATTQFYSFHYTAVWVAIFFFLLRQPLMNMAGPMTTELVMNYVGKRNRELVSALTSASWFF